MLSDMLRDRFNRKVGEKEQQLLDELVEAFNAFLIANKDHEIKPLDSGYLHAPQIAEWAKEKGLLTPKLASFIEDAGTDRSQAWSEPEIAGQPQSLEIRHTTRLFELQLAAIEHFWGTDEKRTPECAAKADTVVDWLVREWTARGIPGKPSRSLCEKMQTIIRPEHLK